MSSFMAGIAWFITAVCIFMTFSTFDDGAPIVWIIAAVGWLQVALMKKDFDELENK